MKKLLILIALTAPISLLQGGQMFSRQSNTSSQIVNRAIKEAKQRDLDAKKLLKQKKANLQQGDAIAQTSGGVFDEEAFSQKNQPSLRFFDENFSVNDIHQLFQWLNRNPLFKDLSFDLASFNQHFPIFVNALQNNQSLSHLQITNSNLGAQEINLLLQALTTNTTLRSLNIGINAISSQGAIALANFLQNNQSIEALHLHNCSLDDADVTNIAMALKSNNNLKSLYLTNNTITDAGAQDLLNALKINRTIEQIELSSNDSILPYFTAKIERKLAINRQMNLEQVERNSNQKFVGHRLKFENDLSDMGVYFEN